MLLIYAILALGLNVVVGYTGLLHLGIAAVLRHRGLHHRHPDGRHVSRFSQAFCVAGAVAMAAAAAGVAITAPTCVCAATTSPW